MRGSAKAKKRQKERTTDQNEKRKEKREKRKKRESDPRERFGGERKPRGLNSRSAEQRAGETSRGYSPEKRKRF
ncbi:hypothetical protein QYF36_022500 [Acer negundo]|nr:hypothetical protein QYF36_022500 [Acer negundo]